MDFNMVNAFPSAIVIIFLEGMRLAFIATEGYKLANCFRLEYYENSFLFFK